MPIVRLPDSGRCFQPGLEAGQGIPGRTEKAGVPVFQSPMVTMKFINNATLELESMFAPRGTEIGSMVDILGVGVIIKGESGIGKKRGGARPDRTWLQPLSPMM